VNSIAFRRERQATWAELEMLVARIEGDGLQELSPEDTSRLPTLYRATLSSLSVARAISLDANLLAYLEGLSARAYVATYGAKRAPLAAVETFVRHTFPAAVRAARKKVTLSVLVTLLGVVTGLVLTRNDVTRFYALVPEAQAQGRGPSSTTQELRAVLYHHGSTSDMLVGFAMFLFTHNAGVGMTCFATGPAAGIPTILLLFSNGLLLGAFAALYGERGLGLEFWAWILPHGVTELLAVILCGAAGLVVAEGLLYPGPQTRLQALAQHGRQAAVIVMGAVLMFFVAGLIEGIFRQVVQAVEVRLVVAVASAAAWAVYFGRAPGTRAP